MSALLVQPDVSFIREVRAAGGGDLKKCFQCAACSVVCDQSPDASVCTAIPRDFARA